MTAEVIRTQALNPKFTLYLNTEGRPVQRTVLEMTEGEVGLAIQWAETELMECEANAKPLMAAIENIMEAKPETATEENHRLYLAAAAAMNALSEASDRLARLLRAIEVVLRSMPQFTPDATLGTLLRHWPGGRHNT